MASPRKAPGNPRQLSERQIKVLRADPFSKKAGKVAPEVFETRDIVRPNLRYATPSGPNIRVGMSPPESVTRRDALRKGVQARQKAAKQLAPKSRRRGGVAGID